MLAHHLRCWAGVAPATTCKTQYVLAQLLYHLNTAHVVCVPRWYEPKIVQETTLVQFLYAICIWSTSFLSDHMTASVLQWEQGIDSMPGQSYQLVFHLYIYSNLLPTDSSDWQSWQTDSVLILGVGSSCRHLGLGTLWPPYHTFNNP